MPFLITTKRPVAPLTRDFPDSSSIVAEHVSRRAVATLEDRRASDGHIDAGGRTSIYAQVINAYGGTGRDDASPEETEHLYQAANMPKSGGTVSLPDGATIEVEPAEWRTLAGVVDPGPGIPKRGSVGAHWPTPDQKAAILAAYNEANAREGSRDA